MKSAETRKAESIAKLKSLGIPYIDWLPIIEEASQVRRRSADEIAGRAIGCLIAIQAACDCNSGEYTPESAQTLMEVLQRYNIGDVLTPNEVKVLNNQAETQEVVNMVWKYEAYWTLLWALGIVKELSVPRDTVDCDFAIQAVAQHKNLDAFMKTVNLRDIEEILDEADLIYRYHWACVEARLNQTPMPSELDNSVVMERHAGLNWLIDADGEDDWDNPDTST